MSDLPKNRHLRFLLCLLYAILAALALWILVRYVLAILLPFIIGYILSRAVLSLGRLCHKYLKFPEKFAYGLITLLLCAALIALISWTVYGIATGIVPLARSLLSFTTTLEERFAEYGTLLERWSDTIGIDLTDSLQTFLKNLATNGLSGTVVPGVLHTAVNLPGLLLAIVATVLSTFFFAAENAAVRSFVRRLLRERIYGKLHKTKELLYTGLFGWLKAQAILGSINFAVLTIGFLILGNPYAPLIALLIAVVDILPVLGSGTVLIPWALIALFMQNYRYAIGCAVLYLVCIVVRNLLESRIVGHQIGLHPLVTLISLYVGFRLFSVLGMFLLPVTMLLLVNFNSLGYLHLWDPEPEPEKASVPAEPPKESE